jgi:hypothetical protein
MTNETYGYSIHTIAAVVLFGDVDNNNIVNMLDLQKTALKFGQTGPPCRIPEDVDNNGVITMLDLMICSQNYGRSC